MPGKSQQGRGKHLARSKKRRATSARAAQQRVVTDKPAPPAVPVPSPVVPRPTATLTNVRHPYIVAELRRIGILAGIVLAILVVLALVLP